MWKTFNHRATLGLLLAASLGGCQIVHTGVRVIGTDLPDGPLDMKCGTYDESMADMSVRVRDLYARGWRIAFALQRDRVQTTWGMSGTSHTFICFVPTGGKPAYVESPNTVR